MCTYLNRAVSAHICSSIWQFRALKWMYLSCFPVFCSTAFNVCSNGFSLWMRRRLFGPFRQSGDEAGVIVDKKAWVFLSWNEAEYCLALTLQMCWGSWCLDGKTRAILPACCTLCADKDFFWQKIQIFSCLREVFAGGKACVCWKKQARKREAEHESLFSCTNPPVAHHTVLMPETFP